MIAIAISVSFLSVPPFAFTYKWNERNLLVNTSDNRYNVDYRYGHDGERTVKHSVSKGGGSHGETMYFNKMWSWRYDGSQYSMAGQNSKHIYLGDTRIATKIFRGDGAEYTEEESVKQYYYHSDHLGSAQLIMNYQGNEYERLEYTPYGEVWTEKVSDTANKLDIPYRFTGKEQDEETGLYYYGARYQDPKTSRWLSADPALASYLPTAGGDNSQLPGMGGIYNTVNMHLYHYAGNNPVKYTDPDGKEILPLFWSMVQNSSFDGPMSMGPAGTFDPNGKANILANFGCLFTAVANIGNTEREKTWKTTPAQTVGTYSTDSKYFQVKVNGTSQEMLMGPNEIKSLLKDMTGTDFGVTYVSGKENIKTSLDFFSNSEMSDVYMIADVGGHFINLTGYEDGNIQYHDTYRRDSSKDYSLEDVQKIIILEQK